MIKSLTVLLLLTLPTTIFGAGGIYVKNLHKMCLSAHQKCIFSCAYAEGADCTEKGIGEKTQLCSDQCMTEYKSCEKELDVLRCISVRNPVLPEYSANFVPDLQQNEEDENEENFNRSRHLNDDATERQQ